MVDTLYTVLTWFSIGITLTFGLCFLVLKIPKIPTLDSYKKARSAMAVAYISLSVLNIIEILTRSDIPNIEFTQSITLVMSALQALLFTCTLIILINSRFVTKRWILIESGVIILLSILLFMTLLVGSGKTLPYKILFYFFIIYYIVMLIRYVILFLRNYRQYLHQADNFFSEEETARFRWIFFTFFAALAVGTAVLLLTFSETILHYILFTCLFICFYSYFGIKFVNYALLFHKIEPVVAEVSLNNENRNHTSSDIDIEIMLSKWVKRKGFTEKSITIEQLANELKTNRTYLSTYLNSMYKQSFSTWINNLRIEEAKYLLMHETDLSVGEIGIMIGYSDKSNFGRQFTKRVGETPNVWRKSK